LGEQFIPIGTGTATTAVVVELIQSDSAGQSRAEVKWFSPWELQELVEQPLKYFLEDYQAFNKKGDGKKPSRRLRSTPAEDRLPQPNEPALSSPKYRQLLWRMLAAAKRARQTETTKKVGGDNDLAVTEIILLHYESYAREYHRGFQQIENLAELADWTRQPLYWGIWDEKPLDSYRFGEVKSFFTKTVRLHTSVHRAVDGLTILDAPGFGISNIHDRICRSAQIGAEAVFLIIGQQIGQDQMREMQQLSAGLKDNLFVIWNSKDDTKRNAQELLDSALIKLKNETGIVVTKERTAVANLHLALRAMQWNIVQAEGKLQEQTEDSLKDRFSRIYRFDPSKHKIESGIKRELRVAIGRFTDAFDDEEIASEALDDALGLSGWHDVVRLLSKAKEIPQRQKELKFALSLVNASIRYLEGFPTTKEIKKLNQAIDSLNDIAHNLVTKIIKKNRRDMESEWESESVRVFDDFLDYITDRQELKNLKSSLADKIKNATHYSTVLAKLVAGVDDYVRARSAVWIERIALFKRTAGKECILSPYNAATYEIVQWIKREWAQHSELTGSLEIPAAPPPAVKMDDFRKEFIAWNKVLVDNTFSSSWVESSITFVRETASKALHEVKKAASGFWRTAKKWWYGTEEKTPPPKETPSFNKSKAIGEMQEKVDAHFSKRTLRGLYEMGEDQSAFTEAMSKREGASYETWADVILDYMETKNIAFWWERCSKLYAAWDNASGQIKQSLDDSLVSWASSIEPILKERVRNLSSKSPESVKLETLTEVERLFESSEIAALADETLGSAIGQLNRVINARKVDS
jgi:hypothetical protein